MKTLPIIEGEATQVGARPSWDLETTIVGAPPGWDGLDNVDVPADWEAERTLEDTNAGPPQPPPHPARRAKDASKTLLGPTPEHDLSDGKPAARQVQKPERSAPPSSRPAIEVEVRKISSAASVARRAPPAYEIWTKNRVYALDSALICVDVIDLASGQSDRRHPFIGGQLVGGQRRVHDNNELTFPLPTPNAEAVFQTKDPSGRQRLVVTSRVTRVILHVQVVRVASQEKDDTWSQITSSRNPILGGHQ